MKSTTAALSLAALFVAAGAGAHDRAVHATAASTAAMPSRAVDDSVYQESDKLFLWRVHWMNHSEIQAGEIAKSNGTGEGIAAFGATLARDHRKAEAAVAKLAQKKGLTLELSRDEYQRVRESLTEEMMMQMDLAHERGAAFDREFLSHMADGHEAALRFLRDYRAKTTDTEIRALIDELLPAFQEHHRTANALLGRTKGDRQDVKGVDDADVEKAAGSKAKGSNTKSEKHKDQGETDQQNEIPKEIEHRLEPPADSGDTPDLQPM